MCILLYEAARATGHKATSIIPIRRTWEMLCRRRIFHLHLSACWNFDIFNQLWTPLGAAPLSRFSFARAKKCENKSERAQVTWDFNPVGRNEKHRDSQYKVGKCARQGSNVKVEYPEEMKWISKYSNAIYRNFTSMLFEQRSFRHYVDEDLISTMDE